MKINPKILLGFVLGMSLTNFTWWLRLKQEWALEEMIFYLKEGDISIFLNIGMIIFQGFIVLLVIFLILNRKKRRNLNQRRKE